MVSLFKGAVASKAESLLFVRRNNSASAFLRDRTHYYTTSSVHPSISVIEAQADLDVASEEAEWAELEEQTLSAAEFDELAAYLLSSGEASA